MDRILEMLPHHIADIIRQNDNNNFLQLEEIRIRVGRPIELLVNHTPHFPKHYIVSKDDAQQILNRLSQFSLYTIEEELKRGFITIEGGHRVGLAGKVITEAGKVKAIRTVSSFNIRVARQILGAADPIIPYIFDTKWKSTLIIGPPQTGKTTLLRDIARIISTGEKANGISSAKVGIVDERSEIAGCVKGVPQHSLGPRVDVLDSCPKADGMMMLIRSMSPDVIIADEIGRKEDTEAILEALHAGVKLFVSAHGQDYDDVLKRPAFNDFSKYNVFERIIELSREKGVGTIKSIKNQQGKEMKLTMGAIR